MPRAWQSSPRGVTRFGEERLQFMVPVYREDIPAPRDDNAELDEIVTRQGPLVRSPSRQASAQEQNGDGTVEESQQNDIYG